MNKPITLCDRCDIAASCLLNYDGVPCRKNRTVEPTRADRVRGMTDEDLAEFLEKVGGCGPSFDKEYCNNVNGCPEGINCWLDWLKQEANE